MTKLRDDLAAARATGPKGAQKSSIVPELSSGPVGLPGWSHFLPPDRELADAWRGKQRTETVESMLNDSQVAALRQVVRLPAHTYLIELDPRDCPAGAAQKLADDLDVPLKGGEHRDDFADDFSARRHLDRAMDALDFGHAAFEQAGRLDEDGWWRLTDLPPVPQWTIDDANSWEIDRFGHLVQLIQWGCQPPVKLPADRLVVFTWQGRPGDPRGRSMLRPLYPSWLLRDRTMRVMGMSAERTGMGIPVGNVGENPMPGATEAMEQLLRGLAAGDTTNLVLQSDKALRDSIMLMGVTGSTPNLVEMLRYHDEAMARAMLAMLVQLGQTETGSRALGSTFDDLLGLFRDTVLRWYCDTMNRQLVARWMERNPVEGSPRLVWRRAEDGEPVEAAEEPQEAEVVEGTAEEVDGPAQLPAPMSARHGTRRRRVVAAATAPDVTPTSAMVAFYPSAALAQAIAVPGGLEVDDLHMTLAFLGDVTDEWDTDALTACVAGWAAACGPMTGEISGKGLFTAGELPVTYASLDLPGLPAQRELLVTMLTRAGFPPSMTHGFTPHMTIAYDDLPDWAPPADPAVTFDTVSLVLGPDRTDYRLAGSTGAMLARRQRAVRASFATVAGRDLRRDPTPVELAAATDFATIEAQFVTTRENVASALLSIRDQLAAVAVEEVAQMAEVDPLTLADTLAPLLEAQAAEMDSAPLVALLVAFAVAGMHQVVGEAARQGVSLDADIDYTERAQADAADLMRRMARQVAESAGSAARSGVPAGLSGGPAADVVLEHLGSLTAAGPEQAAAGASSRAQNAGRAAAIASGDPFSVVATEILDIGTCGPCFLVDGREYGSLEEAMLDYPAGGFQACAGGERCRGLLFALFRIEPEL